VPQQLIRTALDLELQEGTVIADSARRSPPAGHAAVPPSPREVLVPVVTRCVAPKPRRKSTLR